MYQWCRQDFALQCSCLKTKQFSQSSYPEEYEMGRYLVNSKQTQPCLSSSSHVCRRNTKSWLEEKVASTQIPHQMAEYDLAVGTEHGTSGSSFCDNYDLNLPSAMGSIPFFFFFFLL